MEGFEENLIDETEGVEEELVGLMTQEFANEIAMTSVEVDFDQIDVPTQDGSD